MPTSATPVPDVPIRSLQEIVNALDEHPEWRHALRQRLLGEELLALPGLFAKFAGETTRRLDLLTEQVERLTSDMRTVKSDMRTVKSDMRTVKSDIHSMRNDVGELKGARAEAETRARIKRIAEELDLEYEGTLDYSELRRMAKENGADLQDDDIKSFLDSDLIARTVAGDGTTTYIAVEASYTGDRHDGERAEKHAALLERFTKKPCRAVIASKRNNERVSRMIKSGRVAWHQLKVRLS